MKLPKPESRLSLSGVGNPKRWTMIVEGRWTGFWTGVRLPSTPLNHQYQNPSSNVKFSAFKNVFGVVFEFDDQIKGQGYPLTIGGVRRWVLDEYGLDISKSSVCAVRDKCGADKLEIGAGKIVPKLKSKKELAVLEAFKALGFMAEKEEQWD